MNEQDFVRFAADLKRAGIDAEFLPDSDPDGLHVLRMNSVDFYFNADGSGYDGWGRRLGARSGTHGRPPGGE